VRGTGANWPDLSWAADVIRPGPGPLRTLKFRGHSFERVAELLGPNESLAAIETPYHTPLDVDPMNFRLLRGSLLSERNMGLRRSLASLISALDSAEEDISSEVGFAIRRAQARAATRDPR
jgi:hypothetical protein